MALAARQHAFGVSHDLCADDPCADDPLSDAAKEPGQQNWIELLCDGLTFDLAGLAPGSASVFPVIEHCFDFTEIPAPATCDALSIRPGPHLTAGGRSLPVVRAMLALARDLTLCFDDIIALCWSPSRSVMGRQFFETVVTAWLDGGPFPALGLTAFAQTDDGALQSVGLDFWIGQELRIEPPLSNDRVAATRLGIRLVNQLVLGGAITADERILAPDGARLVLRPARDRSVIGVWRE